MHLYCKVSRNRHKGKTEGRKEVVEVGRTSLNPFRESGSDHTAMTYLRSILLLAFLTRTLAFPRPSPDLIPVPGGRFLPRRCVHEIPSGAHIWYVLSIAWLLL